VVRAKEVCRRIERLGGVYVRTRGSHRHYVVRYDGGVVRTRVAMHPGDIAVGTLYAIQRDLAPVFGRRWLTG
jgi:predicted RNA binding protein YcfA (HicA-like mRNA interferase family)